MGRHRRSAHGPAASESPTGVGGRRRGTRRNHWAPVRTGLLGASAAMAMGAVAVSSGLVPGNEYTLGTGSDSGGGVQIGGPPISDLQGQGSASNAPTGSGAEQGTSDGQASGGSTPNAHSSGRPTASPSELASAGATDDGGQGQPGDDGGAGGHGAADPTSTFAPGSLPSAPQGTTSGATEAQARQQVLAQVNKERGAAGCKPLTDDPKLDRLAEDFSDDMARRDFFGHVDPDGNTPWDRAKKAGITDLAAENIARGQPDAQAVVDAWMGSTGHRDNILNCDYKTVGVGTHFGQGGPWWTQDFGY